MTTYQYFAFTVLPYLALGVCLVGSILRYKVTAFKYSTLSSQFLEGRTLFWGSVPFHWGMVFLFLGHLIAWLIPSAVLAWNQQPVRLLVLEASAFAFGLCALWGLAVLFVRRITHPRLAVVTNWVDIALEILLIAQVVLGLWTALAYRWGSSWFASSLSPYLWSLVKFQPDMSAVAALPVVVQLHVFGAFLIVLILPFTRLVHFLVAPFHYIGRPYQQVRWNWNRKEIREPGTPWTLTRPKNN